MAPPDRDSQRFPMRVVTRRTGLTPDVLRAWERRYGVVTPERSEGGQRVYTSADIERLRLLHRATLAGHNISEVARLDATALVELVAHAETADRARRDAKEHAEADVDRTLRTCLAAVAQLDGTTLDHELRRAAIGLGLTRFVDLVVSPLVREVGTRWHSGALTPAHEHLASAVVRRVLAWITDTFAPADDAPVILVGTAAGEQHELGAMLVHAVAAEEGWDVVYVGVDLPAEAIGAAARERGARVIAISAVYESKAGSIPREIARIAAQLPSDVTLVVGGAAAASVGSALEQSGVRVIPDLHALRRLLREERELRIE